MTQFISHRLCIGITDAKKEDTSLETVIKRADEALYQAKVEGRNRVVYH
ncbi:MAG: diguanylate cyclase [Desulfobacterales bacterium]